MEFFQQLDSKIAPHRAPLEKFFEPLVALDEVLFKSASEALQKPFGKYWVEDSTCLTGCRLAETDVYVVPVCLFGLRLQYFHQDQEWQTRFRYKHRSPLPGVHVQSL